MNSIQLSSGSTHTLPSYQSNSQCDTSSKNVDQIAQQQFQNLNLSLEKQRFHLAFNEALNLIGVMRHDLQVTNALFLEKIMQEEKKILSEKLNHNIDAKIEEVILQSSDSDLKNAKENIEDAMDCLQKVSLLDQLISLKDYPIETELLKTTLIDQLYARIDQVLKELDILKNKFSELTHLTSLSSFHTQIFELIKQNKDDLMIAKKLYRSKNFIKETDNAIPVKKLKTNEVKDYIESVSKIILKIQNEIETKTSLNRIEPALKKYRTLKEEVSTSIPLFIQNGSFLAAHYLVQIQKEYQEKIANLESSLDSSWKLKLYADVLDKAILDFEKTVLKIHDLSQNKRLIDELIILDELKSPYAKDLREIISIKAEGKIEKFILKLSQYEDLLGMTAEVFQEKNPENKEVLDEISKKLRLKIKEAKELTNVFAIKTWFWKLEPEMIKIEDLTVKQLDAYLVKIDEIIDQTEKELIDDALKAGFSWD